MARFIFILAYGICLQENLGSGYDFVKINSHSIDFKLEWIWSTWVYLNKISIFVFFRIPILIANENDYYSTSKGKFLKKVYSSHLEKFRKLHPTALVKKKSYIILTNIQ